MYNDLSGYSLKERISILKLNHDRADVIIPACEIYLTVMKWAGPRMLIYAPMAAIRHLMNH